MLKKYFFIYIICILCSCSGDEQDNVVNPFNGSVLGTIVDSQTNEPLAGAQVCIYPGGRVYITGSDGMYDFQGLQNGIYMIQASKDRHLSTTKTINVKEDAVQHCDIQMKQGEPCLRIVMGELNYSDNTDSKTFVISNVGDKQMEWKLYSDYASIVSWDKTNGVLGANENTEVSVTINKSVINRDITNFPIYVVTDNEELGAIATIRPRTLERLNSLLVGDWNMVYHEFYYTDNETLVYNSYSDNISRWIFKDDYTIEVYDRWIWPESDKASDCIDFTYYNNTFEYDQAKSVMRLKNGQIFQIQTLDENTLRMHTIEIVGNRYYDYYTFERNN